MTRLSCLLFFVVFLCAAGQSGPDGEQKRLSPPARTAVPASISGTVVNSMDGAPLEGVHVRLAQAQYEASPPAPYGATSDALGHFAIAALAPGLYRINLERYGFVMVRGKKGNVAEDGDIELKPGEHVQDVILAMAPRAIISGRVLDEYGDPIMNVFVKADPISPQKLRDAYPGWRMTNDRGEFRLSLEPGKYRILAGTVPIIDWRTQLTRNPANNAESTYRTTYYPSATSSSAATVLEAKPGSEAAGFEIRLVRTAVLAISGVLLSSGDCESQVTVLAQSVSASEGDDSERRQAALDFGDHNAPPKFQFLRLAPGAYRVHAECKAGSHMMRSQVIEMALTDSNVSNLVLTLAQGPDIKDIMGKAEWTASSLFSQERKANRTVLLLPITGYREPVRTADIFPDGNFILKDVLPDRYLLDVSPLPDSGCIMAFQNNETNLAEGVLDVSSGAEGTRLRITLSANCAQVTGWVTDDEGQPASWRGTIIIFADPPGGTSYENWQPPRVNSSGTRYGFAGLRPGKYKLLTSPQTFSSTGEVHEFIKEHFGSGQAIEIKTEGEKISKDLTIHDEDPK
jgi:hypothetical protein